MTPVIEVDSLVHRYGSVPAVDGISLHIDDGTFVIVAGRNGSGKTTLAKHFNALLDPDEGRVLVNGRPAQDDRVAARTSVGMVFQNPRDGFVASTVAADVAFGPENLGLPHDEIDRRVEDALDVVQLTERGDERIDHLSGGEQARVAIAGALAMGPDHLVLDEPFVGLDEPARRSIIQRLYDLHDGGTGLILLTHDLRDVFDRADRVVVLSAGRIAVDGPPAAVVDDLPPHGVRAPC